MAIANNVRTPRLVEYSPEQDRENIRSILALLLIGLVIFEILGLGGVASYAVLHPDKDLGVDKAVSAIKDIAGLVLTPSIALAGAVMGFYYATTKGK
jgi:hypothetical protein